MAKTYDGRDLVMVYGEKIDGTWTWAKNQVLHFNIGIFVALLIVSSTVQQQISTQQANNAYVSTLLAQLGQQVAQYDDGVNSALTSVNSTLRILSLFRMDLQTFLS